MCQQCLTMTSKPRWKAFLPLLKRRSLKHNKNVVKSPFLLRDGHVVFFPGDSRWRYSLYLALKAGSSSSGHCLRWWLLMKLRQTWAYRNNRAHWIWCFIIWWFPSGQAPNVSYIKTNRCSLCRDLKSFRRQFSECLTDWNLNRYQVHKMTWVAKAMQLQRSSETTRLMLLIFLLLHQLLSRISHFKI